MGNAGGKYSKTPTKSLCYEKYSLLSYLFNSRNVLLDTTEDLGSVEYHCVDLCIY